MSDQFNYLFTPIKVGPVELKNRIVFLPHGTGFVEHNLPAIESSVGNRRLHMPCSVGHPGYYGEQQARYLAERCKGGAGLVISGGGPIHPTAAYEIHTMLGNLWDKQCIPGLKLMADMCHEAGGKIFLQLMHAGNQAHGQPISKIPVWAPSNVQSVGSVGLGREIPKAMEVEDIMEIVESYGICAENAVEAGMDGVEIHAGTDYLLHQFHSPLHNKRTDEYGGSLENRMRFSLEVIDRVYAVTQGEVAVGWRMTAEDFTPGGLTLEDTKEIAKALEDTGKIDYINLNSGLRIMIGMSMYDAHCPLVLYSAALKETVNIPVIASQRVVDPLECENILGDGQADMIGMCRSLIADAEFAHKAKEGRLDEIRYCVGCNQLCFGNSLHCLPIGCTNNPSVGKEKEWGLGTLKPADRKKKVTVIGGGPAGMEAAWVAAARGHDVTLYEKADELGGQVNLSAKLPGRAESEDWSRWRRQMCKKHGVTIILGKEVTAEDVLADNPDAVVVATGSRPRREGMQGVTGAPIAGWDQPHVLVVDEILDGSREMEKDRVIILDEESHIKAVGLAEMFADQGKQVEIITRHDVIGVDLEAITRMTAAGRLASRGVTLHLNLFPMVITPESIQALNVLTHEMIEIDAEEADVVIITGRDPNEDLYFELKERVEDLYRVGDCVAPRLVSAATYDGHWVGTEI